MVPTFSVRNHDKGQSPLASQAHSILVRNIRLVFALLRIYSTAPQDESKPLVHTTKLVSLNADQSSQIDIHFGPIDSDLRVITRVVKGHHAALQRCEHSFPRIKFGMQAARAAGENLELVREQYSQGTVNVTDLLDAQNQKLSADQFANSAIYEFMGDLVELQRAIAWFELDNPPEQRDAFVGRILSAISEEQQ